MGKHTMKVHTISGNKTALKVRQKDMLCEMYKIFTSVKRDFTTERIASSTVNDKKLGSIFFERIPQRTPASI